jgi:hypothetical protein
VTLASPDPLHIMLQYSASIGLSEREKRLTVVTVTRAQHARNDGSRSDPEGKTIMSHHERAEKWLVARCQLFGGSGLRGDCDPP